MMFLICKFGFVLIMVLPMLLDI